MSHCFLSRAAIPNFQVGCARLQRHSKIQIHTTHGGRDRLPKLTPTAFTLESYEISDDSRTGDCEFPVYLMDQMIANKLSQ